MPSVVPVAQTARILAIVQAGGQGSRMDVLTRFSTKRAASTSISPGGGRGTWTGRAVATGG